MPQDIERLKYELWSQPAGPELFAAPPNKRLVAEGDSWFDYPPGLDILDNLKLHLGYKIYKIAESGDTLENMVYGTEIKSNFQPRVPQILETLDAIRKHKPWAVLFSSGGNDIAGYEMESFLNHAESGLPVLRASYVSDIFSGTFKAAYQSFFARVWAINPKLHIIGHGYGNAIPDGRAVSFIGITFRGPWLRPALARKRVLDAAAARRVITDLMTAFNDMLRGLAQSEPRFHYIDLRTLIADADWVNELHLSNNAYLRVAQRFDQEIQALTANPWT